MALDHVMVQDSRPRALAEQLTGEFLRNGNIEAARGTMASQSTAALLPASAGHLAHVGLPEYGFSGLAVQAVGYTEGTIDEAVYIYVSKGGRAALNRLSRDVEGIKIQVVNVGRLVIKPEVASSANNRGNFYEYQGRIACGSSCAPSGTYYAGTGTFGALISMEGQMMALSNNHVFAACNQVPVGQPILAPSPADASPGVPAPRLLGNHADIVELRSGTPLLVPQAHCDAAVAHIPDISEVSSWQGDTTGGYDTPTLTTNPATGLRVKKVGRTTGVTFGTVETRTTVFALPYTSPFFTASVWFSGAWPVRADNGEQFALPGDSGSLVVTEDGESAVGLLFAAGAKGDYGFIAPIDTVLSEFNATLVSGHGV